MNKRFAAALTTLVLAQQVLAAPAYYLAVPLKAGLSTGPVTPEQPTPPESAQQALLSTSAHISFPVSQAGEHPAPLKVVITNTGNAAASVQSMLLVGVDAAQFELQAACLDIAVGGACEAYVYFKGATAGAFQASLAITYAGGSTSELHVPVSATVVAPTGVLTGAGDFGNVPVGSAKDLVVKLRNTGIGRLASSGATVTGDGFTLVATDCGASLPVGGSCSATVRMEGVEAKQQVGQFSIRAGGAELVLPLSGVGQQSNLTFSTGAIPSFGLVNVGESATSASITLRNTGNVAANNIAISTTDPRFRLSGTNCATSLAAGASCTFRAEFEPDSAGAVSAELLVTVDTEVLARMPLTGVGASSTVLLGANNGQYQGVLGVKTSGWFYTVTNTAAQPLTINSIDLRHETGLISINRESSASECGSTLAAGATCRYSFTFSASDAVPTQALHFTVDTSSGIFTNSSVTGYMSWAKLQPTPASPNLNFGSVKLGEYADSGVITLTNTALSITTVGLSYSVPSDFQVINNTCGDKTVRQSKCTLQVRFAPQKTGPISGVVSLTTMPIDRPTAVPFTLSIPVQGTAVAPAELGWSGGAFDLVEVNSDRELSYSLYNPGDAPVSLSALAVTGNSEFSLVNSTCGGSLAAKAACQATVKFSPTAAGVRSPGVLTVNIGGTAVQKELTANAASATLKASRATLAFPNVYRGGAGVVNGFNGITLTVQNTGAAAAETLTQTIEYDNPGQGQGFYFNNSNCVNRLNAGASCSAQVRAAGTKVGTYTGKAVFSTPSHRIEVPFSVSIVAPEVDITEVTPVAVTKVGSGSLSTYQVKMDATRKGDLATTAPSITGNKTEFSVASGTTCSGVIMNPTASCAISILFTPTDIGARPPATLTMTIGNVKRSLSLEGTGA